MKHVAELESEAQADRARDRIARLFKFVAALHAQRNPAVRQLSDHEWILRLADVPSHVSIELRSEIDPGADVEAEEEPSDTAPLVLLRCQRPTRIEPPAHPEVLDGWLGRAWEDPRSAPEPVSSRNVPQREEPVQFEDDAERVSALAAYRTIWERWATNERISIEAGAIFERLYELHGMLQRDAERFELVVADGILVWRRPEGGVRYPLLSRSVRLEFQPEIPEFRIVGTDAPTEFYSALFRSMPDVDGQAIGRLRAEAEALDPHPLGTAETNGYLRGVATRLSPRGTFMADGVPPAERDDPVIGRSSVLALRRRTSGVARAIDAVVEDALTATAFPTSLLNIVGAPASNEAADPDVAGTSRPHLLDANADETVLFTKPANAEQLDIARCLERDSCVLVQGPPGTGKTHTIANLLGHLLAQGKSVLVASNTTKALKVLRDKVVPRLQPLCVSVLDSVDDDAALKSSIEGIVERIGSADAGRLEREAARFEAERASLVAQVRALQASVVDARLDEQRAVVIGGEATSPIDAAKEVAAGAGVHDFIPSPVVLGEPFPLTSSEVAALYATNETVSLDDESRLAAPLPDLQGLPVPDEFASFVAERRDLEQCDRLHRADLWDTSRADVDTESLDAALQAADQALRVREQLPTWSHHLVNIGMDSEERKAWDTLLSEAEKLREEVLASRELILTHAPRLADVIPAERAFDIYAAIADATRASGKPPSFLTLLTRRDWKLAIEGARVGADSRPRTVEHFEALCAYARLTERREAFRRRWSMQVEPIGGPSGLELGSDPEVSSRNFAPLIRTALDWFATSWNPVRSRLLEIGFRWDAASAEADARFPSEAGIARIARLLQDELPEMFASERARRRWTALDHSLKLMRSASARWQGVPAENLRQAIGSLNGTRYREAFDEIHRLAMLSDRMETRKELLRRLEVVAPAWAGEIRARAGIHGLRSVPGNVVAAWRWRQFEEELNRRDAMSLPDLLLQLEHRRDALREATAELVDRKAWLAQLARTSLEQRQALVGFAGAKRRLGRGTGKRAAAYARMARELMTKARSAVPVWIMPIVKAAEVFDPRSTHFDVVIVDESSQSDVTGLLTLYLGDQVIVVGDDEQVSPSAVGEKALDAQHLIDEFLQGIPNAQLYDGKQSLYDIAKASFGGTICLLEHFRCVPDIIRFSNALSYDGRIRPLREPQPSDPAPAVVAYRVASSGVTGKINLDEARTVAALVASLVEQPEYAGKSIGIVSLVGEDQAYRVEEMLRAILPPSEIESRRLLAGSAAHFQGDERNVMFLSLVDAGQGVTLPLRQERMFQQRFNVAASRARDQMWVVHSLDPITELKADDLRRKLIEHALDPQALRRNESEALSRAESPFESAVVQRLSAAGYRVITQHWVGAYRIDIVVQVDQGRRLAVECDGDRFHRIEDLERDAERQATLERVGWTFVRIRGSRFYRDQDEAMRPVFDRLRALGINPLSASSSQSAPEAGSDLLMRIRARASEILLDLAEREAEGVLFVRRPARRTNTRQASPPVAVGLA